MVMSSSTRMHVPKEPYSDLLIFNKPNFSQLESPTETMEACRGLGATGRSCSGPFTAKSNMIKQHSDEDFGPIMGSFHNPITNFSQLESPKETMEAYRVLGATGRSCSGPFTANSNMIKQHSDEDFGPIMGSFYNPITSESIVNGENFTTEGPIMETLVPSYEIRAGLTEFLRLEENSDGHSGAIGGSFCNTINAKSIANAKYFAADGSMVDKLVPNHKIDSSLTEFRSLKDAYFWGSYVAVRPFLPTTTPLALNVDAINEVFYPENQVRFRPILQQNIYDANQPENQVKFLQKLHAKGGELQPQPQLDFLQKLHAKDYHNQPKPLEEAKEEEEVLIIGEIPAPKKDRRSRKRKFCTIVSDEERRLDSSGWTKYGEKTLIGSLYPKAYYRCRVKRCPGRKQVEKISENPDKFAVWFNNDHQHGQNPAAKCNAFDAEPFLQPTPMATTTASRDILNGFVMTNDLIKNEGEDCFQYIKIEKEPKEWYEEYYNDAV